jgi:two-component system chemotaxis sensor kinase CheA
VADERREKHAKVYVEEATELLAELEESLLELEESPGDMEIVGRVFRAMHTIKGSGAMFGFDEIAGFTHDVETVFDLVRNRRVEVGKGLIDLTLRAVDYIRRLLLAHGGSGFVEEREGEGIRAGFLAFLPREQGAEAAAPVISGPAAEVEQAARFALTYRIRFRPRRDIYLTGVAPLRLIEELGGLGLCWHVARLDEIPALDALDPEGCYTYWDIILVTRRDLNAIRDVFVFVEDTSEVTIEVVDEGTLYVDDLDYKKIGEILVERGDVEREEILRLIDERRPIGEILVERGLIERSAIESALLEQRRIKEARKQRHDNAASASVRVPAPKLDKLVDLVGELVTVQARLTQLALSRLDGDVLGVAETVERLVAELHDTTMSVRMVPIGSMFGSFRRLVRDLADELGKHVRLVTRGAETELDKNVIDRLHDPLLHLIRNAIDHGIETPGTREAVGKLAEGTITLSASHSGADVLIEIADDGAGIDLEAVRLHAVERGLISEDARPSPEETRELLFLPGFSTARRVTGVSGRGVGMDVVRKGIESLRGAIELRSNKGRETSVTLRLPLTLAIVDGLLVRVGDEAFIFPLAEVLECLELTRGMIEAAHGRNVLNVRGEPLPYVTLREQFALGGTRPPIEQVVIVSMHGQRLGFAVDVVVGSHQTVIKALGKVFRSARGLSGATILGDGSVALILDVERLYRMTREEEGRSVSAL